MDAWVFIDGVTKTKNLITALIDGAWAKLFGSIPDRSGPFLFPHFIINIVCIWASFFFFGYYFVWTLIQIFISEDRSLDREKLWLLAKWFIIPGIIMGPQLWDFFATLFNKAFN